MARATAPMSDGRSRTSPPRSHMKTVPPARTPCLRAFHANALCRWERGSAACWSTRWFPRAAVEPECPGLYRADLEQPGRRPGICGQMCPYFVLIRGLDGVQRLLAVANWAAQDDKAVVDEPVHECRVPGPALLVPDLTRGVPAWTVDQPHRKIGHARSVRATTDVQGYLCAAI